MKRLNLRHVLILSVLIALSWPALASDDPLVATVYRRANVFSGPGVSFPITGVLETDSPVRIVERNQVGSWLYVRREGEDERVLTEGWVLGGYLSRSANLRYSDVPVNTEITDGDIQGAAFLLTQPLYTVPVVPTEIDRRMLAVYTHGQLLGNHSDVITKVGDSVSANPFYLELISRGDHQLGPFDYLRGPIDFFSDGISASTAARIGLSSLVIFDPMWADNDICQPGESPLACEYRIKKPSVAFIMFGPNDVRSMDEIEYADNMRLIIEETISQGIIPVLSTFSTDPNAELWWQSVNFNLALIELATEYDVPLINLWLAARALPDYGLDQDVVHLKNSGFEYLKYDTGHEAFYGVSLHNLLSLYTLDMLREALDMDRDVE